MKPLVLALNPSIDAEWRVARVLPSEKNEVLSERRWPGGKGVNVARWLKHLGRKANLLLPLGGPAGQELSRQLRAEELPAWVIRTRIPTRVNVIVTPEVGTQYRFNPVWHKLSPAQWIELASAIGPRIAAASRLVLSGSMPRGVPVFTYAQLVRKASDQGIEVILDCDGSAFAAAVKAHPFLVKPNEHELASWVGYELGSEMEIVRAAQELSRRTRGWVLVSRGALGGLLVNREQGRVLSAVAPKARVLNTVGAGDALLAAAVDRIEAGAPPEEWLRAGIATGTAATACQGGHLPSRAALTKLLTQVQVRNL